MQTKNVVSNNLKEFVLSLESAVKAGYSVVEESVDFHAGFFKSLTQKEGAVEVEDDIGSRMTLTVLNSADALEMLDNPGEPNEKLKEILDSELKIAQQKPKRGRK